MNKRNLIVFVFAAILAGIIFLLGLPFYILDPGYTTIHLRLGKIVDSQTESGCYFKMPFIDTVVKIDNRINKSVIETSALTKDLQTVKTEVAINYKISNAVALYKNVGTDFEHIIINPFAQESIKAIVAKFTAEDLIQSRHEAKESVFQELKARLVPVYIEFVDFNFVHLDFHTDFIKAVEDKQIAEQQAKMAKNLTEKVKEEALQTKAKAEAEAYALNVKKASVTKELIELKKTDAFIKAIDKWNGVLPQMVGAQTPFISFNASNNEK
jgi:regulator of protease activity HflC (stomatin/prohibitin superfamily)